MTAESGFHARPSGMPVDIRRYPGIRRLAGDYAYSFGPLAAFFNGHPSDPAAWLASVQRAQAQPRDREALAAVVAAQQQRRGAPPEARAALDRLRKRDAVTVITGQQAGAFGGPLFTLLKAVTALKLAARLRQEQKVPASAVFWIDAEDHDWAEIAACSVLDADSQPRAVRLPDPAGAGTRPVGTLTLGDGVTRALDELASWLPPTEFTATLMTRLRSAYRPGAGVADAFGRMLEFTLGELGLVVYDASDPAAKPLAREVFVRETQFPGLTAELAASAGARLVDLGYHAQVSAHGGTLALFSLERGREPVRFGDGTFHAGDRTLRQDELAALASARPELFSPNVLLRPVVQDAIFPTVAYVAGPNELAYLGQLKPVYEHFGVPMPLMVPRASATLLDSAGVRFLTRYGVPVEALQAQDESTLNKLLEDALPPEVEGAWQAAAAALDRELGRLVRAVPAIDPTLEGAAKSAAGRVNHELHGLHAKIIQAAKRRDETLRRQFGRTRSQAFPGGHAQERAVGFVSFLNRFGPGLVDQLLEQLPLDLGHHWVLAV